MSDAPPTSTNRADGPLQDALPGGGPRRILLAAALVAVFALALGVRLEVAHSSSGPVTSDMGEYDRLAAAMAGEIPVEDLRVVNRPAGYPFFLSTVYRTFGHRYRPAYLVQALLGALTCLLAVGAGRAVGQPWPAALGVGLALALTSSLARLSGLLLSESLFLPLAVGGLWALAASARRGAPGEARLQWLGGALLGLAMATRSAGLYLPVAAVAWALWRQGSWRPRLLGSARVLAGCGVALLAVSLLGVAILGEWVVLDRHTSANLWIGNNPRATGTYHIPPGLPAAGTDAALGFIRENPAQFLALTMDRFGRVWTWTPDRFHPYVDGPFGTRVRRNVDRTLFLLACGLAAVALIRLPRERGVRLVALALLVACATLSLTFVIPRFRIALLPMLWILAGSGTAALVQSVGWRRRMMLAGNALVVVALLGTLSAVASPWGEVELLTGNAEVAVGRARVVFGGAEGLEPQPEMHPTGTGAVQTELLDGLRTGTGNPTWECLLWKAPSPYVAFRARVLIDLGELARIERVEAWTVSPYGNYRIDRVALALSADGARFDPAGIATNDRPRGDMEAFPLSLDVGGVPARFAELTLIQHHGSGTVMPLCEVRIFGRRARASGDLDPRP